MENEADPVIEVYWERYKPKSFKEMIGNEDFKQNFENKSIFEYIHSIFAGPPGTGKSLGIELIEKKTFKGNSKTWNMSIKGTIDNVETSVLKFCEGSSLDNVPRLLAVFQESDRMSKPAQEAMRVPMEAYAKRVVFIQSVNYLHKIIDPIQSRSCVVQFELATESELREFCDRIVTGE